MAVTLTGAGGLFTRLGKIAKALHAENEWRGASGSLVGTSLAAFVDVAESELDGDSVAIRSTAGTLLTDLAQTLSDQRLIQLSLQNFAKALIIEQVNEDTPLPALIVQAAIAQLIAQMKTGGYHVAAPTISVGITPGGSNVGNGVMLAAAVDGADLPTQYQFNETVLLAPSSTKTLGSEVFLATGAAAQKDPLHWLWPGGSGIALDGITSCDPAAGKNYATSGGFDVFTAANTPDNWTIDVGTAGTDLFSEGTTKYAGANALRFAGGTGHNTQISQALIGIQPLTTYPLNLWLKCDVVPAAGVLTIDLVDGSGTVINDEQGNANSLAVTLSATSTSFVAHNKFFRTPNGIPAVLKIRVRLSTALSGGSNLYIDSLALPQATSLYAGGPTVQFFSGSTNWNGDDYFSLAVNNDYGSKWQQAFNQLFGMPALGLLLPTAGATLIAESLLT